MEIAGEKLKGDYILEVPVQDKPVPKVMRLLAEQYNVTIRDIGGKVYK
jgi:hypothetical protein